jgi:hypothetical protein
VERDQDVVDLVEALRTYGVLTHDALRERSGASQWREHSYEGALRRGVDNGSIKKLGDDLFEAADDAPDENEGRYDPS